jgi:hypothetical protein
MVRCDATTAKCWAQVQTLPRRITCGIPLHHLLRCSNSASLHAPQNQLQLAECTCRKSCRKSCVVGGDVLSGVAPEVLAKPFLLWRFQPPFYITF